MFFKIMSRFLRIKVYSFKKVLIWFNAVFETVEKNSKIR